MNGIFHVKCNSQQRKKERERESNKKSVHSPKRCQYMRLFQWHVVIFCWFSFDITILYKPCWVEIAKMIANTQTDKNPRRAIFFAVAVVQCWLWFFFLHFFLSTIFYFKLKLMFCFSWTIYTTRLVKRLSLQRLSLFRTELPKRIFAALKRLSNSRKKSTPTMNMISSVGSSRQFQFMIRMRQR